MKRLIGILLMAGTLCACCQQATECKQPTAMLVGNDADEHGCKASAGYVWSELRQECVRVWEAGSKLVYTNTANNQEENLYVVFNNDSTQLETFGSNKQLWTRTENSTSWISADQQQRLERTQEGWVLK